jgi:ribose transport system ATP-binding protein
MDNKSNGVILEADGITKSFPGVVALDDVHLDVYAGQLNAVVGENGAGKSTLMNVLAGVFAPDAGQILLDGDEVTLASTGEALERGIAMIHQELNLVPQLSVTENIFMGREMVNRLGLLDWRLMNARAAEIIAKVELSADPRRAVSGLRVGQQQLVEIAKALSFDARIIIMDEPTSAISGHEIDILFDLIKTLKERGVAIVYITHKLDELFRIGDRVTVLRDGKLVGSGLLTDLTHDDVVRMMVGRNLQDHYKKSPSGRREEALRAEQISLKHPKRKGDYQVEDVSLSVMRGEVLGIFGLMGAGRTELLEAVFGLHPDRVTGEIFVEGTKASIQSPSDAIGTGIGLAPEDRKEEGLVLIMSVGANVSLPSLERTERFGLLRAGLEKGLVNKYVERLRIKTPSLAQVVQNLSGGNQQKVVLAKWLATEPKVLLLDEPTRGIDINAKEEIYALIDELTRAGLGIVMVSSELPEILAISDRIMVMSEGRKTGEFSRDEATEELVMKAALPRSA